MKNKVALVTAAGQGIGRAIAEAFIAEGGNVIATDLAEDKLKACRPPSAQKLDVRAQDNIDALQRRSRPNSARSTFWSIAPAMSPTARCSIAPRRTGTFPSTSTSNRCIA